MSSSSTEFHKIESRTATGNIPKRFGLKDALDDLIGQRLFNRNSAQNPESIIEAPERQKLERSERIR